MATLTVAGISGVATFSGVSQVFVNQGGSVGIGNGPNSSAVPDVLEYCLSRFGLFNVWTVNPDWPVTGIATGNPTFEYQTGDGVFVLSSATQVKRPPLPQALQAQHRSLRTTSQSAREL